MKTEIYEYFMMLHALKLLRNHLLDARYKFKIGKLMTKEPFIKQIEMQSGVGDFYVRIR